MDMKIKLLKKNNHPTTQKQWNNATQPSIWNDSTPTHISYKFVLLW